MEIPEKSLLAIRNLRVHFYTYLGIVKALDGVNLDLKSKTKMGLVGETGCGKSVTALSIMKLVPFPGKIVSGVITFDGKDLSKTNDNEMSFIRGNRISMIFQEPISYVNPVFTVGDQVAQVMMVHQGITKGEAKQKAVEIFRKVNLPDPEKMATKYPHELSGGMLQRVLIAMALSCDPQLLIADEPTTFLDVTTQQQILELLTRLVERLGASMLLITHNLGVVAGICDEACVMYAGKIVEKASVRVLFKNPMHPYTKGLLRSVPRLTESKKRLQVIPGTIPDLIYPPPGCRFYPRCPYSKNICKKVPPTIEFEKGHFVSCHHLS